MNLSRPGRRSRSSGLSASRSSLRCLPARTPSPGSGRGTTPRSRAAWRRCWDLRSGRPPEQPKEHCDVGRHLAVVVGVAPRRLLAEHEVRWPTSFGSMSSSSTGGSSALTQGRLPTLATSPPCSAPSRANCSVRSRRPHRSLPNMLAPSPARPFLRPRSRRWT